MKAAGIYDAGGSSGKAKGLIDFASTPENASRSEPQVGAADPRPEVGPKFTGAGRQAAGEAGDKFIGIGTMLQNIFACMRTRLDSTLQQIDKQAAVSQAATTFRDCRGESSTVPSAPTTLRLWVAKIHPQTHTSAAMCRTAGTLGCC